MWSLGRGQGLCFRLYIPVDYPGHVYFRQTEVFATAAVNPVVRRPVVDGDTIWLFPWRWEGPGSAEGMAPLDASFRRPKRCSLPRLSSSWGGALTRFFASIFPESPAIEPLVVTTWSDHPSRAALGTSQPGAPSLPTGEVWRVFLRPSTVVIDIRAPAPCRCQDGVDRPDGTDAVNESRILLHVDIAAQVRRAHNQPHGWSGRCRMRAAEPRFVATPAAELADIPRPLPRLGPGPYAMLILPAQMNSARNDGMGRQHRCVEGGGAQLRGPEEPRPLTEDMLTVNVAPHCRSALRQSLFKMIR